MALPRVIVAAVLVVGCAVAPASTPSAPVVSSDAVEPAVAVVEPARRSEVTTSPCMYRVEPPMPAPPLEAPDGDPCIRPPRAVSRALAAEIRERSKRSASGQKLEIRDGCDRMGPVLDLVVVESRQDYGSPLTLTSLERDDDGDHELVRLEFRRAAHERDAKDPWLVVGKLVMIRARVPGPMVAPLLARLRAAVHVEIDATLKSPALYGTGSMAHHFMMSLVDVRGRGVEHGYAAWASEGPQAWRLASAERAVDEFLAQPAIRASLRSVTTDDPEVRALFSRRFWRRMGPEFTLDTLGRAEYLAMAASLGSAQHMPALLAALEPGGRDAERVEALRAIAAITGHDRRYDAAGKPRPVKQVAAETLAACRSVSPGG